MVNSENYEVGLLQSESTICKNKIKSYKRRWIILCIYIAYAAIGSFQWIEYSSVTNIIVDFYKISSLEVDWTSILYMAVYPILVVPASYIIDKEGLRTAGILGCAATLIGTAIKLFSLKSDLFIVVLIGQIILAAAQVMIVCLPPKIAAVWFETSEVSIACSLGVFGSQFGVAVGYVLPPFLLSHHDNSIDIGSGLYHLCLGLTLAMVPVSVGVLAYFQNQPLLPPSITQASLLDSNEEFSSKTFFISLKSLLLNKGFLIHMTGYGINIGVYSAVSTLLNQFVTHTFEDAELDAGWMGFVMVMSGLAGAIFFAVLLDKTHKYMTITMVIYIFSILSMIALMYSFESSNKFLTYISCGLVGLFTTAYMPVGLEYAMELTFPSEESTTTGILMAMSQILGVLFTVFAGYLNKEWGCFWSLASQALLLTVGAIITCFVPNRLLRQEALSQMTSALRKSSMHRSRLVFIQ